VLLLKWPIFLPAGAARKGAVPSAMLAIPWWSVGSGGGRGRGRWAAELQHSP